MAGGYDPDFFALLDAVEDRHFWFRGRARVIDSLSRQLTANLPTGHRILELGCGNGGMLRALANACPAAQVIGMDLFAEGLWHARRRTNCPLVQADVCRAPFSTRFELIGMFDVLEHIPDDRGILREVNKLLSPEGALLMTVPAHPELWSYFDEASQHCRRYTMEELRGKLEEAELVVEYLTPFMGCLYPLMRIGRWVKSLRRNRDATAMTAAELRITPGLNGLLDLLLKREARSIEERRQLSSGTSLLAVARRAT